MNWMMFPYFAIAALVLWISAAAFSWRDRFRTATGLSATGSVVFFVFILGMWISTGQPPMRTMGETRLWYVFFISVAGATVYLRWKYRWILSFSAIMETVFTCVNLFKPEIHSRNLMPALQSPWFAPHVISYMFAYALLGASALMAVYLLWIKKDRIEHREMAICDNLVGVGLAFMTFGMLLGAIWAEQAWGHYWSWDPKETWAAATWFSYLAYIHLRHKAGTSDKNKTTTCLLILLFGFLFLQICWYGINYLPSARGISIHTYSN